MRWQVSTGFFTYFHSRGCRNTRQDSIDILQPIFQPKDCLKLGSPVADTKKIRCLVPSDCGTNCPQPKLVILFHQGTLAVISSKLSIACRNEILL